jgi:hypothetical protein
VSEVNVRAHDRVLSEAGFRTKGGRGSSAAKMVAEDAARLLIALGGGGLAKDAAVSTATFSDLTYAGNRYDVLNDADMITLFGHPDPPSAGGLQLELIEHLPHNHTFLEALVALICSAQSGQLEAAVDGREPDTSPTGRRSLGTWEITVKFKGPQAGAEISIGCDDELSILSYELPESIIKSGDLRREFFVTHQTILGLGQILRK